MCSWLAHPGICAPASHAALLAAPCGNLDARNQVPRCHHAALLHLRRALHWALSCSLDAALSAPVLCSVLGGCEAGAGLATAEPVDSWACAQAPGGGGRCLLLHNPPALCPGDLCVLSLPPLLTLSPHSVQGLCSVRRGSGRATCAYPVAHNRHLLNQSTCWCFLLSFQLRTQHHTSPHSPYNTVKFSGGGRHICPCLQQTVTLSSILHLN